MDRIDDQKDWGENIKKKMQFILSVICFSFLFYSNVFEKKKNVIIQNKTSYEIEQSE